MSSEGCYQFIDASISEEARRCEQLLIRKEYYKREAMVKTTAPSLSRHGNTSVHKSLGEDDGDRSCSLQYKTRKLSPMFRDKVTKQAGICGSVVGLPNLPSSNRREEREKQERDSPNFWKERDQIIKKRAYVSFHILRCNVGAFDLTLEIFINAAFFSVKNTCEISKISFIALGISFRSSSWCIVGQMY